MKDTFQWKYDHWHSTRGMLHLNINPSGKTWKSKWTYCNILYFISESLQPNGFKRRISLYLQLLEPNIKAEVFTDTINIKIHGWDPWHRKAVILLYVFWCFDIQISGYCLASRAHHSRLYLLAVISRGSYNTTSSETPQLTLERLIKNKPCFTKPNFSQ